MRNADSHKHVKIILSSHPVGMAHPATDPPRRPAGGARVTWLCEACCEPFLQLAVFVTWVTSGNFIHLKIRRHQRRTPTASPQDPAGLHNNANLSPTYPPTPIPCEAAYCESSNRPSTNSSSQTTACPASMLSGPTLRSFSNALMQSNSKSFKVTDNTDEPSAPSQRTLARLQCRKHDSHVPRRVHHHHCRLYAVITDVQRRFRPVPLHDLFLQRQIMPQQQARA